MTLIVNLQSAVLDNSFNNCQVASQYFGHHENLKNTTPENRKFAERLRIYDETVNQKFVIFPNCRIFLQLAPLLMCICSSLHFSVGSNHAVFYLFIFFSTTTLLING